MAADNHIIVGNLVEDPELRFTNAGIAVANLRVNVWRRQAEHLANSLFVKGDRVMVTGRQRSWETPKATCAWSPEIEADEVGASLTWAAAALSAPASAATATAPKAASGRLSTAASTTVPI